MTDSPTLALGEFAAGLTYDALPDSVKVALANLLLDWLRVASVGERMEWSGWSRDYISTDGGQGNAGILFSDATTDAASAAFLNTTYSGSIDADDVHVGSMLHPGCIIFPAALAVGQQFGHSGRDVLAAVVAGYEAMIRTSLAIQPSHFKRGFQSTATCGGFGAATAVGALLFKDAEGPKRIAETLGLTASFAGGLAQFYQSGSTVKRIHAAWAAQSGVRAGLLARQGFSGPADILEGSAGFAQAYADAVDFAPLFEGLGETYKLLEVTVKGHASSARVMAAVEGMAALGAEHGYDHGNIDHIRIGIPSVIKGRLTMADPIDIQAAQMSLPFSMAVAAKRAPEAGAELALTVTDYLDTVDDEEVRDLARRINCEVDTSMDEQAAGDSVPADITVKLKDGAEHSIYISAPKGSPSSPFSREDHVTRFKNELGTRYSEDHVNRLLQRLERFSDLDNVAELRDDLGNS